MTRDKLEFRQALLESEAIDPARKQRFEREVNAMWETKMTVGRQVWFKVVALISLLMGVGFAFLAIAMPAGFPLLARIGFGVGSLFAFGWLIATVQVARSGVLRLRTDPMRIAGLTWGFVVLMVTIFMLLAGSMPDPVRGVLLIVNGLVFLIGGGLILMRTVIEQSELRTRERLLEIEYRLEQISDDLKKRDGGDDEFEPARI